MVLNMADFGVVGDFGGGVVVVVVVIDGWMYPCTYVSISTGLIVITVESQADREEASEFERSTIISVIKDMKNGTIGRIFPRIFRVGARLSLLCIFDNRDIQISTI
jgi:hypothetical protein